MKRLLMFVVMFLLAGCGAMAPDGDAGEDQVVTLGETVTLDGTQSDQKNGDTLTYSWAIVASPSGSRAALSDQTAARPTFTPDLVGTYIFELVVDNDFHQSDPVQVTVKCGAAGATKPVAISTDPSGQVSIYAITPRDNFRTTSNVNFSLEYTIENVGTERVDISFVVYGVNAAGVDVFTREINTAIGGDEQRVAVISFGEALTIAEYDSITAWDIDPIVIIEPAPQI